MLGPVLALRSFIGENMRFTVLVAFVLSFALSVPLAFAEPSTKPATNPSSKYPSPAELVEQMKKNQAKRDALLKVAYFDLGQSITEKPSDFSFFGANKGTTLQMLLDRIDAARDDKNI